MHFNCFATGLHPCFVVFDVLLVNGKSIASLPLKERVENLKKCVEGYKTMRDAAFRNVSSQTHK